MDALPRYDAENRVTSITQDGNPTTFAYDDFGRRLVKTVGSGTTVYWSADYEEKYVSGTLAESTKFYMANGQKIAQRSSVSGLMYIHQDHLGSTTKLTDASGAVTQSMGYTPYGSDAYSLGGDYTDYQFTGQEKDASTGLYYYGARYYDPDLGLFLQADTVLDGMNRYAYCGNNPVMYNDPTGFENTSIQTSPNTSLTLGDYYDGPDNRTDSANDSDESAQDDDDSDDQQSAETETKVQSGGGGGGGSGGGGSESQSSKKKNKGKAKEKNEGAAEVKSGVGRFNIIDFGIDYSGDAWNELQRGNIIGWAGYELASTSELVVGLCAAYYGPLFVRAAITAAPVLLDKAKTIIGEKIAASKVVNTTERAILKNGYYEVNGFKFSEYYYNKLWNTGRGGPSLVAREVLENASQIVRDDVKAGFNRYVYGIWEMVYNPITKEVWHIQPIKP